MDILLILLLGVIFAGLIITSYQPKVKKAKENFEEMNRKFKEHIDSLPEEDKSRFFNSLNDNSRSFFEGNFASMDNMNYMNQIQFQQHMDEFNRFAMDESFKIITPFDHGGYVMGAGFNPSDTMAFEAQQQMEHNSFNQMNDMGSSFDSFNNNNGF